MLYRAIKCIAMGFSTEVMFGTLLKKRPTATSRDARNTSEIVVSRGTYWNVVGN